MPRIQVIRGAAFGLALLFACCSAGWSQSVSSRTNDEPHPAERHFFRNVARDQVDIYTSPVKLRADDAKWLVPLTGATIGVLMNDRTISRELTRGSHLNTANTFSNAGAFALAGTAGSLYVLGHLKANDHFRETGVLATEAALDATGVTYVSKYAFGRERPFEGDGTGHFFRSGDSFISAHASFSWAVATVMANEYPGWLSRTFFYGTASAVSVARVAAGKHFMGDVVAGSAVGYLIGKHVYNAHHDNDLGGVYVTSWEPNPDEPQRRRLASTYVVMDSWIYPALERLSSMGYIRSEFMGMRPWTRIECARMVSQADELTADYQDDKQPMSLLRALRAEFAVELRAIGGYSEESFQLESLYTRTTAIAGPILNDSFHFGQTIVNDYGRPFGRGFNNVSGFTSHGESGPFAFYVRGEYQHAPALQPYSSSVAATLAVNDRTPVPAGEPQQLQDQFRLLDTYVSLNLWNNQFSVGKQSLWWGPGEMGSLMFSTNAEPIYMVRLDRTNPLHLPKPLSFFGPVRYQFFFGKLSGHSFPREPYINALKLSFHPTKNLEIGFSRMAVFAGQGFTPLTFDTFFRSITSTASTSNLPRKDPGDRRAGFDIRYKLPWLRDRVTLYTDSLSDDDPSPIDAPRRAAINPGVYISRLPGLSRFDLRLESQYTDVPAGRSVRGQFIYVNDRYLDSHTNKGVILGSIVGREGKVLQASTTYWWSGGEGITARYRQGKTAADFVPGGGTTHTAEAQLRFNRLHSFRIDAIAGIQRWTYPLLAVGPQQNGYASLTLAWLPKLGLR